MTPNSDRQQLTHDELRRVQLRVLRTVTEHCQSLGLVYYLGWGTLLGAVRHGGYIPWDDDIDLMMPREDYRRLEESFAARASNPPGITVHSLATVADWPFPFMKVSDPSTVLVEFMDHAAEFGVNVDIFPIDGSPRRPGVKWVQTRSINALRNMHALRVMTPREGRARWKHVVQRLAWFLLRPLKPSTLASAWNTVARSGRMDRADLAGVRVGPSDWLAPTTSLAPASALSFENSSFSAPHDPDQVLGAIYGDYMRLPPLEKQVSTHRFVAFWV